ncbi:MAG: hypothetical protein ACWA6R_02895 [Nitrosomonas sp.]
MICLNKKGLIKVIVFAMLGWITSNIVYAAQCPEDTLQADVVAIDHPMVFNRLGAQNVNWMMYALRHDIVDISNPNDLKTLDYSDAGNVLFEKVKSKHASRDIALRPDLRPRPLVLRVAAGDYLRVNFTNLLHQKLKHFPAPEPDFLEPKTGEEIEQQPSNPPNYSNPFNNPTPLKGMEHPAQWPPKDFSKIDNPPAGFNLSEDDFHRVYTSDDQVASRHVGFHPQGLELVTNIDDDSSYVGKNGNSLAAPGETKTYCFRAEKEGAYLVSNTGAVFGGEGTSGNSGVGLFGAVTVQPSSESYKKDKDEALRTRFFRAQVTEEEMRLATRKDDDGKEIKTPTGQPVIDFNATYPQDCAANGGASGVWCREGKAGKPILNMVHKEIDHISQKTVKRIWHGDINAIIVGPNDDGSFPADTYPLESIGDRNPTLPTRLEPFREFVSIFHDENAATQAFPYFFEHPELSHTLHGVRDAFMINYGSGGIGAEIIANRLQAGPMNDCLDCAYEEFFLSSFVVGDAAMLVDKPANLFTSQCQPEYVRMIKDPDDPSGKKEILDPKFKNERKQYCTQPTEQRAQEAYYPHDPANVHHSYIGDFVKFRNMHVGKEQHIFHLHNHQWLFNPNDDNSNYIDAQGIGPGTGYTYEIAFGGSGNRNKTVGDAIFHCHFYPHFAQGMWYLWRNHDVFEAGTRLDVSDKSTDSFHIKPFGLKSGKPSPTARALPDGEIISGAPIPAIVPLPGKGMAPLPLNVTVKPKVIDEIIRDKEDRVTSIQDKENGSVAVVEIPFDENDEKLNPGYPFWVAGVAYYNKQGEEFDSTKQSVSIGSRPTTPPLDMCNTSNCPSELVNKIDGVDGHDGGLPRHALGGFITGGKAHSKVDRLSAEKIVELAKPIYYLETGTRLEQMAMRFHEKKRPGHLTNAIDRHGNILIDKEYHFAINGAPRVPGAPFNEPCIDDKGKLLEEFGDGEFFGGFDSGEKGLIKEFINVKDSLPGGIEFGALNPRIYKGANIQLDVVFNKLGYHYPQQRILALWKDVGPLLDNIKPPEPLVLRMNTFDCAMYAHTNLIPAAFYADDYQITTPTDVIGQHIHLPKWDLTSADGSANGWNYEDGTFSPDTVRERIHAINKWNENVPEHLKIKPSNGLPKLKPTVHPYFNSNIKGHQEDKCTKYWEEVKGDALAFQINYGSKPGICNWLGARTTLQRWFSDPIVNRFGIHRGLGTTFTHDHLGPSTHQQLGLYATMLTEPPGSEWWSNELDKDKGTKVKLYDRDDGGPTSWQAVITGKDGEEIDVDGDGHDDSHREFFLQFGDFQHAYVKGAFYGVNERGVGWIWEEKDPENSGKKTSKPTSVSFHEAINPSVRKPADPASPDIIAFKPTCPGGKYTSPDALLPGSVYLKENNFSDSKFYNHDGEPLRPCPEAISADDIGMMVMNYRNEPIGARVYDPKATGRDGKKGSQADGFRGDLAYAMQTRTDRAIAALNDEKGHTPYELLTGGVLDGDPFTPILRAYSGDKIKVKIQGGAHEHEHNAAINGMAWLQAGSGFGQAPHSGWRNSQNAGLSEQFTFHANITDYESPFGMNDRMYTVDSSQDGLWNGVWGVIRSYNRVPVHQKLMPLTNRSQPVLLAPGDDEKGERVDRACPTDATRINYRISAVLANYALGNQVNATLPQWKSKHYRWWEWQWWQPEHRSHLNPAGGTLVYNPRSTSISIQIRDQKGDVVKSETFGTGPLHDPTAIMFVLDEDLENGKIRPGAPVEPLVLRAAAGDCIQITLTNRLPEDAEKMPDLDGFTSLSGIIPRNCSDLGSHRSGQCKRDPEKQKSAVSFNNNLIRASNHIGLHPQMVHYDVQSADGNNVGFNAVNTVEPGKAKRFSWYAGTLEIPSNVCTVDSNSDEAREAYETLNYFAMPKKASLSRADLFTVRNIAEDITNFKTRKLDVWGSEHSRKIREIFQPDNTVFFHPDSLNKEKNRRAIMEHYKKWRLTEDGLVQNMIYWLDEAITFDPKWDSKCFRALEDTDTGAVTEQKLFDRGKIVKALAKCVDEEFRKPPETLWPISQYTTKLIQIEKENGQLENGKECQLARYVAVEYGATNLTPPDRIKQGQKGAVGALIIEPEKASWHEKDRVIDRQVFNTDQSATRATRTMADVTYPTATSVRKFRDLVMIHQKGLNLRYKDGKPVANLAAEKENAGEDPLQTAPEDAHDSGHMAINYGAEPLWFRFGLPPDAPFGKSGFGGADSTWQAFSNDCCDNGGVIVTEHKLKDGMFRTRDSLGTVTSADQPVREPYVPIMKAYAGQEMRLRALLPTGVGRASTMQLHGHAWQRDPYLAEFVDPEGYPRGGNRHGIYTDKNLIQKGWGMPSKCIGGNALAMHLGGQESVAPMSHFDFVFPSAGGLHEITGDFLWRDLGGFGITNGLWALVRVEDAPVEYREFGQKSLRTQCDVVAAHEAIQ